MPVDLPRAIQKLNLRELGRCPTSDLGIGNQRLTVETAIGAILPFWTFESSCRLAGLCQSLRSSAQQNGPRLGGRGPRTDRKAVFRRRRLHDSRSPQGRQGLLPRILLLLRVRTASRFRRLARLIALLWLRTCLGGRSFRVLTAHAVILRMGVLRMAFHVPASPEIRQGDA